jgi:hypothetical protein
MEALEIIAGQIALLGIALLFGYIMQCLFNYIFNQTDDFNKHKKQ